MTEESCIKGKRLMYDINILRSLIKKIETAKKNGQQVEVMVKLFEKETYNIPFPENVLDAIYYQLKCELTGRENEFAAL